MYGLAQELGAIGQLADKPGEMVQVRYRLLTTALARLRLLTPTPPLLPPEALRLHHENRVLAAVRRGGAAA